jgi:MoaD family protein
MVHVITQLFKFRLGVYFLAVVKSLQISVRFFTILREIVGKKEEILRFSRNQKVTVNTVLEKLGERYGKAFREYVYDSKNGEVKGFLQLLVNGRSLSKTEGLNSELSDGDVVAILPPVSGG